MKILITGSKGQLGTDCAQVLCTNHEILALDLPDIDITSLPGVEGIVQKFSPDVIVNCAAYTQVDACETEKELAWNVNAKGPRNLALSAQRHRSQLVHVSTDYVFDGGKNPPEPYTEDDEPNPFSFYGKTKLGGEVAVRGISTNHIIVRTAWLYGFNGHNILKTFLRLALENPSNEIKVVNDQFGSPAWSYRLALQIAKLIEVKGQGTYHATSEGYCTWYDLARYFLEKMGIPHRVVPCTTEEYPTPACRPKNSILENKNLKEQGVNLMPLWKNDVDQFVAEFGGRLIEETKREPAA